MYIARDNNERIPGMVTIRLYRHDPPPRFAKGGLVQAAEAVRKNGRWGDSHLIHVNPEELAELRQRWGEPTLNPHTGLPEYGFLSKLWKGIKKVAKVLAPVALNFLMPGAGAAVGSALKIGTTAGKALLGAGIGGLTGGKKGAILGGVTGGIAGGAGSKLGSFLGASGKLAPIVGNALLSGAGNKLAGGDFGKGALLGGGLTWASPYIQQGLDKMGIQGSMGSVTGTDAGGAGGMSVSDGGVGSDGLQEVVMSAPKAGGSLAALAPAMAGAQDGSDVFTGTLDSEMPQERPSAVSSDKQPPGLQNKLLDWAKNNKLEAGLAGLTAVQALTNDAGQDQGPPQAQVPDYLNRPLQLVPFDRKRQLVTPDDYYTYGMRPEWEYYTQNTVPGTGLAEGGPVGMKQVGRGKWVNPESYGDDLVEDYGRVTPNHGKGALALTAMAEAISTSKGHLARMTGDNARRDAARSRIRSEYDENVKGGAPSRGNRFKKRFAEGGPLDMMAEEVGEPAGLPEEAEGEGPMGGLEQFVSQGAGTGGRGDTVDAKLSPGEYVLDSELVAMLGDGDPEAGALKLDAFREKVRRKKGKALAKGKISPDTGPLEQYIKV